MADTDCDGFDLVDTCEAEFWDCTADKCRENPAAGGGHQCLAVHTSAKAKWHGGTWSDGNFGYTGTESTEGLIDGVTVSGMDESVATLTGTATASAIVTIQNATITVDTGGILGNVGNGGNAAAQVIFQDSTISITNGGSNTQYGHLIIRRCTVTVNSGTFRLLTYAGITDIIENDITLTDANVLTRAEGGAANYWRNYVTVATNEVLADYQSTAASSAFAYNVVQGPSGWNGLIDIEAGITAPPVIYGNTFYNITRVIDNNGPAAGSELLVKNNIFHTCTDVYDGATNITLDYNDYYNSENAGGANSITDDPLFNDAASGDFTLDDATPSPCIDDGVDLGASYEDALDPSSVWPDAVVTREQGASWDMGAYGGY